MTFPSFASSARGLRGAQHTLVVALVLLLSVVCSVIATTVLHSGVGPTLWWPAAGVNVIALVVARRRWRWVVLLLIVAITMPASLAAGRPIVVAAVAAVAVALEGWIVTRSATGRDDQPRLTTSTDVLRFFAGVLIGTALSGALTGAMFAIVLGGDPLVTGLSIFASHASAIAVIAPLALVNRLRRPLGRPLVRIVHAAMLAVSVFVAFAPHGLPQLVFLPVPFLAWAAFSFSMLFALIELIGTATLIVVFTALGGGIFVDGRGSMLTDAALLELFVLTLSVTTLLIAAARNERQHLEEQRGATAQLLHQAFETSQSGFAILHRDRGAYRILETNSVGITVLESSLTEQATVADDSALDGLLIDLVASDDDTLEIEWDAPLSPVPVAVTATQVSHSTFGDIVLLSIIDLRPAREAAEALQHRLDREKQVSHELRGLNEQKDVFVSSVTHELRTPVTAVIGFSEELGDTDLDATQRSFLAIILRNAERLLRTIEDIITVSTREQSEPAEIVRLDLRRLTRDVLDDLLHRVRERGLDVVAELPDHEVPVRAAPNDLTRVIVNIITNAVKFTPVGGTITVRVTDANGDAQLTVTDTGPGIAPDELERVFDRFYRSSSASRDEVPGTGLGLAIVRDLVTEIGGTVVLESDGEHGTTARVRLPIVVHEVAGS